MVNESDSLLARSGEENPRLARRRLLAALICVVSASAVVVVSYSLGADLHQRPNRSSLKTGATIDVDLEGSVDTPRYKATQFISFTINTLGGLAEHGECEGRNVDKKGVCYLGTNNITQDLQHRLTILHSVLDRVKDDIHQKHPLIDHSQDVLKIFAMPEFYFRGPYGAYTKEQLFGDDFHSGLLIEFGDRVREYIKDEVFSNYLFVFGTIIGVSTRSGEPIKSPEQLLHPEDLLYANFSPVNKGGPTHRHHFLVTKKYISAVDFLVRQILPNPRDFNDTTYKHKDFSQRFNALLKERRVIAITDNVIDLDGLRIGMEICLDHRMGALWDNLQEHHKSKLVDVQIIASAGMAIERGPNPVVPGGVVYLSDGEASSAACYRSDNGQFDPDKVCRSPGPKGHKHLPQGGGHKYSDFFLLSGCLDLVGHSDLLTGFYSLYAKQGCANTLKTYGINVMKAFDYYPPSLEVYPTVDLPKNAYSRHWS